MEYLGSWVTRDDAKIINRKIEAITNTKPPNYQKEVQTFIDLINYYINMWKIQSHMLALSTKLTPIKRKLEWTKVEQNA